MAKKKEKTNLSSDELTDFIDAFTGKSSVTIDGKDYGNILVALTKYAQKTEDPEMRASLDQLIQDISRPILKKNHAETSEETDDDNLDPETITKLGNLLQKRLLTTAPKEDHEKTEALRSIIPDKAIINNSKLALEITDNFVGEGEIPIVVSKKKARKEFEIIASMAFEEPNLQISGRQPYTAYDRAVLNGICSLWQAGNTAFTPSMVYLAMNGLSGTNEGGVKVSPQSIGAVTRSIEKQRVTRLTIDCTNQMKYYKDLKTAKFDAMMISVDGVEMTAQNGKRVKAYTFTNPNRPPVLYEYSRSIGQVLSVPPRLLNSTAAIRTTEEVIIIREYLIRRIEGMKGQNELKNNRITYKAIYSELAIEIETLTGDALKNTTRRVRKNTEAILTHLKTEGYISDFEEYRTGRTIAGIEIKL